MNHCNIIVLKFQILYSASFSKCHSSHSHGTAPNLKIKLLHRQPVYRLFNILAPEQGPKFWSIILKKKKKAIIVIGGAVPLRGTFIVHRATFVVGLFVGFFIASVVGFLASPLAHRWTFQSSIFRRWSYILTCRLVRTVPLGTNHRLRHHHRYLPHVP